MRQRQGLLGSATLLLATIALLQPACGGAAVHPFDGPAWNDGQIAPSRFLALEGVVNARDMGGFTAHGGRRVRYRRLLRSGDLSALTPAGCAAYADLGIRTLVDLREDAEIAASPDADCAQGPAAHRVPLPKLLPPTPASYLSLFEQADGEIATIFALLGTPDAVPFLHHCVIGRDRASVVAAIILLALGVGEQDVESEFLLSNEAGIQVEAGWIRAVLDEVSARGGIDAYLQGIGVPATDLEALRAAALE